MAGKITTGKKKKFSPMLIILGSIFVCLLFFSIAAIFNIVRAPTLLKPFVPTGVYIQEAQDGILVPTDGANSYILTLETVTPRVLYYANTSPKTIKSMNIATFINSVWNVKPVPSDGARSSFGAALLLYDPKVDHENSLKLQLSEPSFDEVQGTLSYKATVLDNNAGKQLFETKLDANFPHRFNNPALFISE